MGAVIKYTEEETEWLRNNYENFSPEKITEIFNKRFNSNRNVRGIISFASKHGFGNAFYTDEEKEWLIEKCKTVYLRSEIASEFNKLFGRNKTEEAIRSFSRSHHIKFEGKRPPNNWIYTLKGKEILNKLGKDSLSIKYKIGDFLVHGGDPYILISEDPEIEWRFRIMPFAKYIWEKFNGKLKKGYHIYHLDRNKFNNNISNLIAMKPSTWCGLMVNGWADSKELMIVGAKYYELMDLLKNKED